MGSSCFSHLHCEPYVLGGAFPCILGQSNLEVQNGQLVTFSNVTDGHYNQFDFPGLNLFRFIRQK